MVKAKKTDTPKTESVPVVNVETVKDTTNTKSKKAAPKAKVEKTVDPVTTTSNEVVETTEKNVASESTTEVSFVENFNEFMAKLQTITVQMGALKTEFRTLEKRAVREYKAAQKVQAKRKRKSSNRSPSGFVKPTLISNELATFLNKPIGTEMARTEVTREINGYIRAHSLQDKTNGRKINPDKSLATLLKINNGEELTYFNLQRFMSPHFAKAAPKATTTASTAQ